MTKASNIVASVTQRSR